MDSAVHITIVEGDYRINDNLSSVAVAIVGRGQVNVPDDLCHIIGTFKTENLGVEKIIANVVSRPWIRHLVVCGREEFGHFPGDALLHLYEHGVDEDMRIVGTRSPIPFLCNTLLESLDRFREQVTVHDLVEPKDADEIIEYDPRYIFTDVERDRLLSLLKELNQRDDLPFEGEPIVCRSPALITAGEGLGEAMNMLSDRIVTGMLSLADGGLSTTSPFITLNVEPPLVLNPVDGTVLEVNSIELVSRLRDYLTGGQ